jgi:hypothetical protein
VKRENPTACATVNCKLCKYSDNALLILIIRSRTHVPPIYVTCLSKYGQFDCEPFHREVSNLLMLRCGNIVFSTVGFRYMAKFTAQTLLLLYRDGGTCWE